MDSIVKTITLVTRARDDDMFVGKPLSGHINFTALDAIFFIVTCYIATQIKIEGTKYTGGGRAAGQSRFEFSYSSNSAARNLKRNFLCITEFLHRES